MVRDANIAIAINDRMLWVKSKAITSDRHLTMMQLNRLALGAVIFACLWQAPLSHAQNLVRDRLLNPSTSQIATHHAQDAWVKSVAEVQIRKNTIAKRRFWLNTTPGKRVRAYRRGFRSMNSSGASISGRLRSLGRQNGELGHFNLSVTESGGVAGSFQTSSGKSFGITGTTNSATLQEIDENLVPPCGNPRISGPNDPFAVRSYDVMADQSAGSADQSTPPVAALSVSSTVRALVIYPPSVRTKLGSGAAVDAMISNMINYANTAYQNSAVSMTLVKAFSAELSQELPSNADFNSDPFVASLESLTGITDGLWDDVHTLRTTYAADVVVILIDDPAYCGVAWLNDALYNSADDFAPYAFSVVNANNGCISSFAHELGHNMGLNHNIEDSGSNPGSPVPGKYAYSYGWRWQGSNTVWYRDIMAYQSVNGEQRVQYFSNPNVNFAGVATGDALANNALSLENLRDEIADYVGGAPATTPTNTPTPPPGSTSTPIATPVGTAVATATPNSAIVQPPSGGGGGVPVATPTPDGSSIWGIRKFSVNCKNKTAKISIKSADGIPATNEVVTLLINNSGSVTGITDANGIATIKNAKISTAKKLKPVYEGVSWGYSASCKKKAKSRRR